MVLAHTEDYWEKTCLFSLFILNILYSQIMVWLEPIFFLLLFFMMGSLTLSFLSASLAKLENSCLKYGYYF